ncbi:Hsp70 family protein [Saccharopolyspora shandongensis]|uniref:Hsp70 family protein n=1 Tax=Saccharopolyspora shandongensis TaxID=418495 RepID=UPI003441ECDE
MATLSPDIVVPSMATPGPDGTLLTGLAAANSRNATTNPALLARGFKRRLGDPTRLMLGGASYTPAALMAAQLRDVLTHISTAYGGGPPATITLTCPAIWGPYRREQFAEVPRLAGIPHYQLITEPEAAATHYTNERRLGNGEIIAVYDLGGGTFDTTILRVQPHGMEILGTPEGIEHMGGIDFDDTLRAHLDDKLDGAISTLDPEDPTHATALAAIHTLTTHAKEQLSAEPDLTLTIPLPTGNHEVYVSRHDLNNMIRPSLQLTTEALHRTITSAGIHADDVSAILLAGGSSRIPLIHQTLSHEFNKPIRAALHPKHTVALGAATTTTRTAKPQPSNNPVTPTEIIPVTPTEIITTNATPATIRTFPPALPSTTPPKKTRKKWLIPLAAGITAIAVIAAITTYVTASNAETPDPEPIAGSTQPGEPLPVFDGMAAKPWVGLIGSEQKGSTGTEFWTNGAQTKEGPVTVRLDGKGGLKMNWSGGASGQVYFQSQPGSGGNQDLSRYFDNNGAIVFDATLHRPPSSTVSVEVHCSTYPCHAKVTATNLFKRLPAEKQVTVKLPLRCFAENRAEQWDPTAINTPWLVYTDGSFGMTVSKVRWEAGAANDPDATRCDQLS